MLLCGFFSRYVEEYPVLKPGTDTLAAPYTSTSSSSQITTDPSSSAFVYTTIIEGSTAVTPSAGATATKAGSVSSASSAGGASATGNAAAEVKQVGSFAAAVIAIAGVVAIL